MRKNWSLLGRILKHAKWGHFHCFWGYLPAAKRKQVTTYSVPWHQRQAVRLARLTRIVLPKDSHVSSVGWACVEHRAGRDALLQSPPLPPIFLFKKKLLIIHLFSRQSDGVGEETQRRISQTVVHSPNNCNSWRLANLKPGARNPIQVSHVSSRNPTWAIIWCLPCVLCQQGSQIRSKGGTRSWTF